jgi:hypothetical protein
MSRHKALAEDFNDGNVGVSGQYAYKSKAGIAAA